MRKEITPIFLNSSKNNFDLIDNQNLIIHIDSFEKKIYLKIASNCQINVFLIFSNKAKYNKINNFKIKIDCAENCELKINSINLACNAINDEYIINLNEWNSKVDFYLASFVNKKYENNTNILINHNEKKTFSDVKAYYIIKDEAKGFVHCVSNLERGCAGAEAHQELRLTILNNKAAANSDPVLLIKENDIVASHANAIGMIDREILFYMQTKGISESDAIKLVVYGYFEKSFNELKFYNENLTNELIAIIEGSI